ncbi:MAG TPA: GNAT family N-acetyltransferase [Rhizomicrobium sp.]|jgi:GNAT superfamily N-acetyltransferase|nr:GNAT family N-acetyltransferase [Rhizomicrobium sp.]
MIVSRAQSDADIARIYPVMRELRPHLKSAAEFVERVRRQQAGSGWTLIFVEDAGAPVACAGFRICEWLAWGKALYVDDLICLESHRGKGFAEDLMRWMEDFSREQGCAQFHLDSGTHRLGAHRFYHRLKLAVTAFHFQKTL